MRIRALGLGLVTTFGLITSGCGGSDAVTTASGPNFMDEATIAKTARSTRSGLDVATQFARFYGATPPAAEKGDECTNMDDLCPGGGSAELCIRSLLFTDCVTDAGTFGGLAIVDEDGQVYLNLTRDTNLRVRGTYDIDIDLNPSKVGPLVGDAGCQKLDNIAFDVIEAGVTTALDGAVACETADFPIGLLDTDLEGMDVELLWTLDGVADARIRVSVAQEVVADCLYNLTDDTVTCEFVS